jgi:hypothetical protein
MRICGICVLQRWLKKKKDKKKKKKDVFVGMGRNDADSLYE